MMQATGFRSFRLAATTSSFRRRFVVVATTSRRGLVNAAACQGAPLPGPLLSDQSHPHQPVLSANDKPLAGVSSFARRHYFIGASRQQTTTTTTTTTNRSFSSSTSSSQEELCQILAREHAEEIESDTTSIPAELDELKQSLISESGWKIVDDGAVTKMYRSVGGNKVILSFHCQDTVEVTDDGDYVDDEEGLGEEEEEEEEEAGPVRFTATVTKAGKTLAFICLSENAAPRIQSVAVVTSGDADTDVHSKSGVIDSYQYQGPEFNELAEDLQDSFHTYLVEGIGITEDVASFVSMYSDYREQMEYVQFLNDAKSIL